MMQYPANMASLSIKDLTELQYYLNFFLYAIHNHIIHITMLLISKKSNY